MNSYVGTIVFFGGNFEPAGWMRCDGRTLPVLGNEDLFSVIGNTFGGDGVKDFSLPFLDPALGLWALICVNGTLPVRP